VRHISTYVQSACYTMYYVSKYAQSYEEGGFLEEKKIYEDGIQTENFVRVKIENDLYYWEKITIHPIRNDSH